jgi:uncharacterized glyoxalase superfamily protein PhnB
MKLLGLTPMLSVKDLDEAMRFYRDQLGFACVKRAPGWACLKRDAVEIMLALPNQHEPFDRLQFTGSFYFRLDDVDAFWNQIKDRATVVYPLENFPYGMREFAIRDNTGYLLQFGQEIRKRD